MDIRSWRNLFHTLQRPKKSLGAAFDIRMAQLTLKQYEELAKSGGERLTCWPGSWEMPIWYPGIPRARSYGPAFPKTLKWEGCNEKLRWCVYFVKKVTGGGVMFFESVSEDSNIWFHFFRRKVSMFFSTHTVSKKQKNMAFLRMPFFWGVLFFF